MKKSMQKTWLQGACALALSLGVSLAAQAQPADSARAGGVISSQGTIAGSSATTGSYSPPPPTPAPPALGPFADTPYKPWTLAFQGQQKCGFVAWYGTDMDLTLCARITTDGSGNIEVVQIAGLAGNDFTGSGWWESVYPQLSRNWPTWQATPRTFNASIQTLILFSSGTGWDWPLNWSGSMKAYPNLGPSGLPESWSVLYTGTHCVADGYWHLERAEVYGRHDNLIQAAQPSNCVW
jgi:hypothetical protein